VTPIWKFESNEEAEILFSDAKTFFIANFND